MFVIKPRHFPLPCVTLKDRFNTPKIPQSNNLEKRCMYRSPSNKPFKVIGSYI